MAVIKGTGFKLVVGGEIIHTDIVDPDPKLDVDIVWQGRYLTADDIVKSIMKKEGE